MPKSTVFSTVRPEVIYLGVVVVSRVQSSVFGVFGVVSELKELSSYPRNGRKGTRSSAVTRVAAVMMAAELL
jgi:hypothetical protein